MKPNRIKYRISIIVLWLLLLVSNCTNNKAIKLQEVLSNEELSALDNDSKKTDTQLLKTIFEKKIPKIYKENIENLVQSKLALLDNNTDSALYYINLVTYDRSNEKLLDAIVLQNFAYIMQNYNEIDSAGYYFFSSLNLKKDHHFEFLFPNSFYNYGIYLFKKDLYNEAIQNCHEAILYSKNNASINPYYFNLIGNCYYSMEMDDSAQKYYTLGIDKALSQNDSVSYIGIKSNLNNLYTVQRKLDTAIINFNELYEYFNRKNEKYQKAVILSNIGNLFIYKNKIDSALNYLAESNKIAEQFKYYDISKTNFDLLSTAYLAEDNYIKAYQNLKLKHLYDDSLKEIKNNNFVKELEAKYLNDEQKSIIQIQDVELEKKNLQKGIAIIIALLILVMSIIVVLIYQRRIKAEKALHILEVNNVLKDSEDKIFKSLFEGREKERVRLSEELHDGVGSQLAICKMQLSMFTLENINDEKIIGITKLVDKVSKDIRALSHEMNKSNPYGFNIATAIQELCEEINRAGLIHINFNQTGKQIYLEENGNINIYRIVQEIINNTLKHAKAKEINIHLHKDELKITILIEDNGIGFNSKLKSEGIGLKNIRSRIKELNGELTIDSSIGSGTTTIIEIPSKLI